MSKLIRDAVSVIFECDGEIFVIQRQNHLRSFPGYLAFVGGKVDKEDYAHNNLNSKIYSQNPIHLINALIREVKEETDLSLNQIKNLKVDYLGNALSPDFNPVRFNTFFFKVTLKTKIQFDLDDHEIAKGWWSTPDEILAQWSSGEHLIVPPIKYFISNIGNNEIQSYQRVIDDTKVPCVETISDLIQFMPLSNTLPPADRTNCFYLNGDIKIIIDPSPKDNDEKIKLLNSLPPVDKILVTHYHRDHYERVNEMAKELAAPILMTKETFDLISKSQGDSYFKGIEIELLDELECIGQWKSEDVLVHKVFGHAKGHIALAPKSLRWFIAGDLFQGIGSVVVGGENASMSDYFKSLEKVIGLNPKCVIPSHGIALGGVNIIKKNLNHRRRREDQILELHQNHKSTDELYDKIYFGLDPKLKPYAMANIEAHLDKLRHENKLS